MPANFKARSWRIGLVLAIVVLLAGGLYLTRFQESEAFPSMPADEQDYWSWVTTINRGSDEALEVGVSLLSEHPHLERLYLRLADLCLEEKSPETCTTAFDHAVPPSPLAELYRDAARAKLVADRSPEEARPLWLYLAATPDLDPGIARMIVDAARANAEEDWTDNLELTWERTLNAEPSRAGAAFGLGYLAVLRGDWTRGEEYLTRTTTLLPDDPEAYRELGRIYYTTGRPDDFEAALTRGIDAARARHELEKELILRGNLGLGVKQRGDLARAEQIFHTALENSRAIRDKETEGFNLYRLAGIRIDQHRHYEALDLLTLAEELYKSHVPRRFAEIQASQAHSQLALWRFSDAEELSLDAVANAKQSHNVEAELQSLSVLAKVRYEMGRYQAAKEVLTEGIRLATLTRHMEQAVILHIIMGGVEAEELNYDSAKSHYNSALDLASETGNLYRKQEVYRRLGLLALKVYDAISAEEYFRLMMEVAEQRRDAISLFDAHYGLGRTYHLFGNYKEATNYFMKAAGELDSSSSDTYRRVDVRTAAAWSALYDGDPGLARHFLDEAQHISRGDPSTTHEIAIGYANVYLEEEHYEEALSHFDRAEKIRKRYQWNPRWHVYHGIAQTYWGLERYPDAERNFKESIRLIEDVRNGLDHSGDRAVYVQNKGMVYQNYARLLEHLGRHEEAFHYTERARSRSLLDLLFTTQRERAYQEGNPVDEFLEAQRRIRAMSLAESEIGSSESVSSIDLVRRSNVARERVRIDSLRESANLNLQSANRLYTFTPVELDEAQRTLDDHEALVVFDIRRDWRTSSDEDGSVAYVITRYHHFVVSLDLNPDDIPELVTFFRAQISAKGTGKDADWKPASRRLYRSLIVPVREVIPTGVTHLHIVPEGVLHYVPFAALQDSTGRFLVEDFSISVSPSASILGLVRASNPRRWRQVLLFGDPDGRLPGSKEEVLQIAAKSPSRRFAFVGEQATKLALEENVELADILHIATHGRFIRRAPWRSHLEFAGEDLTIADISKLNLAESYLVTLSACETALSGGSIYDVPNGDEWVGLTQAFLAAGAPSVMASLWAIDDRVSGDFMVSFYDELGEDGKADALASVQRRFIEDPIRSHPFYWAAFIIIGDPR